MKTGDFIKINDGVIIKQSSLTGYHKEKYDPMGCHSYIVFHDKKSDTYKMYPTSHYVDPAKQTDVRKGRAILMKLKGAKGLSTVYKIPRTKDVGGHHFRKEFKKFEFLGCLSNSQKKRFKTFVNKK